MADKSTEMLAAYKAQLATLEMSKDNRPEVAALR